MPALTSVQSVVSSASQQWRVQQAQQGAQQAEAEARALRRQASSAQREADRADENARDLKVRSDQADSRAGNARQAIASVDSLEKVDSGFNALREGIAEGLAAIDSPAPVPVINAEGQTTGTTINVTA